MELSKIVVESDGMVTDHNFPCPCCGVRKAILGGGQFNPCYSCQAEGFNIVNLVKSRPWWIPVKLWEQHFRVSTPSAINNKSFFYKEISLEVQT
jgi:hypothetical protein